MFPVALLCQLSLTYDDSYKGKAPPHLYYAWVSETIRRFVLVWHLLIAIAHQNQSFYIVAEHRWSVSGADKTVIITVYLTKSLQSLRMP
jgi:hypothetical protein